MKPLVIGIAGGTGSGKTTLTNRIKHDFAEDVAILYLDNYYRAHDDIPVEERETINYDHPDALETDLLVSHLRSLLEGQSIEMPVYDYSVHNRTKDVCHIDPKRIIVIEGILVLQNEALRSLLDIAIYVDTDADERVLRRVIRDVK
ncbi:MAG: uridine kinase, partial [Lachnospiraceae bacterium]